MNRLVAGEGLGVRTNLAEQPFQRHRRTLQARRPAIRPGNEEQVIDQAAELIGLIDDAPQGVLVDIWPLVSTLEDKLGLTADHGQWRAEFMADVGEELPSGLIGPAEGVVGQV